MADGEGFEQSNIMPYSRTGYQPSAMTPYPMSIHKRRRPTVDHPGFSSRRQSDAGSSAPDCTPRSSNQLQIAVAHTAAALPLVISQPFERGGKRCLGKRLVTLRAAPLLVDRPQLLGRNRLTLRGLQPLLDKAKDMGTRFREAAARKILKRRQGSLREGLRASARPHREYVRGRVRRLPAPALPWVRAPGSDGP